MIRTLSNQIKKSKLDDRVYRYVQLNNCMRCLMVQDVDVEKSAASIFVGSGNLVDP